MLTFTLVGNANAIQLSPSQLNQLQQLSPAQQKALAKKVQGEGSPHNPLSVADNKPNHPSGEPLPVIRPEHPIKKELSSNIEQQFNARLSPFPIDAFDPNNRNAFDPNNRNAFDPNNRNAFDPNDPSKKIKKKDYSREDLSLRSTWDRQTKHRYRSIRQQLHQFGYNQFAGTPTTFIPATAIPIPPQYVLGPGDEIQLHYFGRTNDNLSLILDREGVIYLPNVGPITLANMTFNNAKALLAQTVRRKLPGVTISVSMGQLRSIRIFVLGDASYPGSYLVSGLSTISNALFISGGISKKGSLRHILLKRNGKIIQDLDLYDFLLHGNSKHDQRLMPGDVIFIPPIGKVVAVAGQTVRPAIYELSKGKSTASQLIALAGGVIPGGDHNHMQIDRLTANGERTLIDINSNSSRKATLHDGDLILIFPVPGEFQGTVSLSGKVKRPGSYGLKKGMKLSALLHNQSDLQSDAFLDYALIQRTDATNHTLSILRVSLHDLFMGTSRNADITLHDHDKIYVLSKSNLQPLSQVQAFGEVYQPGTYPLTKGMRILDLLLAAGGPTDKAFLQQVEITRYTIIDGKKREAKHIQIDLRAVLANDDLANLPLVANDQLVVRRIGNWNNIAQFTIRGEVKFPGSYPIQEGEKLSSVIERAGGFSNKAYLRAAVFTRKSIREEQKKQIAEMTKRIRADIAKQEGALSGITDAARLTKMQAGLDSAKQVLLEMEKVQPTGRLILELKDLASLKGSDIDLTLRDGDALLIPQQPNEVLVMGQVYSNTALIYQKKLDRDDYINHAGGLAKLADEDAIYVVHVNGLVEANSSGWSRHRQIIGPGDAIVVPQKLETFDLISSALDWSKILMQLGVGIASMKTIGIL